MDKKEKIKRKVNELKEKGLASSSIRDILNVNQELIVEHILEKDMNLPLIEFNEEAIDFYEDEDGHHFIYETEKYDYRVLQVNMIDGHFNFYNFIGEMKRVRNQMRYCHGENYSCFIAKVKNYRKVKDMDRIFFDKEKLRTEFRVKGNKRLHTLKKGNILQIKFFTKISNNYSYLQERFIYIKEINANKLIGISANTYKRAMAVSKLLG